MPNLGTMYLAVLFLSFSTLVTSEKSKCRICRDLTDNFKKYFEETQGLNFGGGNTAWEEKSLGTYAKSEARLIEILDKTCSKDEYKCSSLLEDQEEWIEEWFFNRQDTADIFEELCVEELKRCCPQNRWGPDCEACPGGIETPCSGHGTCKGEGDRDTTEYKAGNCTCDRGYNGTTCESCKSKFIRVGEECEECSTLCAGQCTAPGPTGCVKCKKGYEVLDPSIGCADINECEAAGCGDPLEECVNSPGSYECICKSGYTRVAGKCQLEDLYAEEGESDGEEKEKEGSDGEEKEKEESDGEEKEKEGSDGEERKKEGSDVEEREGDKEDQEKGRVDDDGYTEVDEIEDNLEQNAEDSIDSNKNEL